MSKPGKNSNKTILIKRKRLNKVQIKKNLNQNKKLSKLENKAIVPPKNRVSQQKRELEKIV